MESEDGSGERPAELRPVVSELGSTAHEARVHVQEAVSGTESTARDEVRDLRQELTETRRELRRLEQYVMALEERVDED